jgi:hypothetical protein
VKDNFYLFEVRDNDEVLGIPESKEETYLSSYLSAEGIS